MLLGACQSAPKRLPYGVVENHSGYVPARIAVFPCQTWPAGARYSSLPLTNVKTQEMQELCTRYDDFVISGFKDQPYMRGYSPKFVNQYLQEFNFGSAPEELPKLWAHSKNDCKDCTTPPAFYKQSVEERTEWRLWLKKVSEAVRNADAILFPFVLYAYETTYDDRGLNVAKRAAAVTLLLVDTNSGYLIWSGGRDAFATTQKLVSKSVDQPLAYPFWEEVFERLFIDDIWKEFPGRQFFK